ncbi:MAG: ATP-binding cassette domain-containing protein [Planctomycetia bacterium]|nr:ATP-binding cassette domain-containing protein [Planctomycetia bacterium]
MDSAGVLLDAQGLGRFVPGTQQWLLRDVSLAVRGGDRLAIVGPTGSGKTLLLRSLALLDPIDEGRVLWLSQTISARLVPAFRSQATYLHQRPALIEGTVEDNLRLPFTFRIHAHQDFDRRRVASMLEMVGRGADFLARSWHDLSGGEAQIVALVRALQLNPTVLLLDEPTASLDASTTQTIERLISHWHERTNGKRALIWVTHDRQQSTRVAQRVVQMNAGKLLEGT